MSVRSLIRTLRSGVNLDRSARSFVPTGGYLSKIGYDSSAKSFGLFGPGSGKMTATSQQDKRAKKTHTAVDQAVQNGDILLVDTSRFNVTKDVKQSVINIYNPRRVILNDKGSADPTTRSERREEELEARRRRRAGDAAAASLAAGAGAGGAANLGLGGGAGGALGSLLLKLLGGGAAFGLGAGASGSLFRRLFRKSPPKTPSTRPTGSSGANLVDDAARAAARPKKTILYNPNGAVDDALRSRTMSAAADVVGERQAAAAFGEAAEIAARRSSPVMFRPGVRPGQFGIKSIIDEYMIRYSMMRDMGGKVVPSSIKAGLGSAATTAGAAAGTRIGLSGAAGIATFGLGVVAEVLAQIAAHRLGKLSDEILMQREGLRYPYGKGRFALNRVMTEFGGMPASVYHGVAAQSLGAFLNGYTDPKTNEFVPGVAQHVQEFKNQYIAEEIATNPPSGKGGLSRGQIAERAERKAKEYEKMLLEQVPPELMLSNPGADKIGEADDLMQGSVRRMMGLHVQKAGFEGENDPIIQGPGTQQFESLQQIIRDAPAATVQEGQNIMESIGGIPLVGRFARFAAEIGANVTDTVSGFFESPPPEVRNNTEPPNANKPAEPVVVPVVVPAAGGGGANATPPVDMGSSTTTRGQENREILDNVIGNGRSTGNPVID